MNLDGLDKVFTSNFYINASYAQSLAPTLYNIFLKTPSLESDLENRKEQKISSIQSNNSLIGSNRYVAILSIKQPILKYDLGWYYLGTKTFRRILDRLAADPDVIGVVLDIDSGGGQSYGTPEFYDYLRSYPKPIGTYTDGYLCSAAYYIGNATQFIVANKRAEAIGSIGAYSHWVDFTGIIEKLGGKSITMYATESTEKNAETRAIEEENDFKPYIKNILDPLVATFQSDMKSARPQLNEIVFKGNTWNAEKSLELGLIDQIGTLETAIAKIIELDNESNNSNPTNMSQEKSFPKIATVLGKGEIEAKKPHIFASNETVSFDVDQLAKIEAALNIEESQIVADLRTQLATAQSEKKAVDEKLKTAEDKATAIETNVNEAIKKAGLEAEKKSTSSENLELLSSKVLEYGGQPGALPTNVNSKGDKTEDEQPFVDEIAAKVDTSNI